MASLVSHAAVHFAGRPRAEPHGGVLGHLGLWELETAHRPHLGAHPRNEFDWSIPHPHTAETVWPIFAGGLPEEEDAEEVSLPMFPRLKGA